MLKAFINFIVAQHAYLYAMYPIGVIAGWIIILILTIWAFLYWAIRYHVWFYLNFHLTRFWMHVPLIGTIARASRKTFHNQHWFRGEEEICRKFVPYYRFFDRNILLYAKSKDYLSKIDELDRTPIPMKSKIIIGGLVIAEAYTFSYLLAGYIIIDASEFIQSIAGFAIAFILSVILLVLTHQVGVEQYENHIKKRIIGYSQESQQSLQPDYNINLENTFKDTQKPNFIQMLNRFKSNSSLKSNYLITSITLTIMLIIAAGATTVRLETYNKYVLEESAIIQSNVFENDSLPQDARKNQEEVDTKIIHDLQTSSKKAGWVSFGVLAVLFFGIQFWGIILGYSYGFSGKESEKAYKYSYKFPTEYDFKKYFNDRKSYVKQIAQRNLSITQSKIAKNIAKGKTFDLSNSSEELVKIAHTRTFSSYMKKENDEIEKMDKERFKMEDRDV